MNRVSRRDFASRLLSFVGMVAAAGTMLATVSPASAQGRNPFSWPFASNSIWNTPIHTSANYGWAGFEGESNWAYSTELEYIAYVDNNTPYVPTYYPGYPYRNDGNDLNWIGSVRVPDWLYIGDVTYNPYSTPNNCAAFVYFGSGNNAGMGSGGIIESQPTTRVQSDKISGYFQKFGSVYGDGLGDGSTPGAHYGSGMSVLGGSIRAGELTSSEPIRHALKFLVYAKKYLYYSQSLPGYKWPAKLADNYANDPNDPDRYQGTNTNLVMGSLVAIPGWRTVNDLQLSSPKARKIAQALLDYGAYIVDDTKYTNYAFGISQEEVGQWDIPASDLQKIVRELWVVTNNGPGSIGGKVNGGVPRVGYAPNF